MSGLRRRPRLRRGSSLRASPGPLPLRGRDEIRHWRETAASKYTYTVEVIDSKAVGEDSYVVTSELKGDFPDSPVQLKFRFSLRDGLIESLEIAP